MVCPLVTLLLIGGMQPAVGEGVAVRLDGTTVAGPVVAVADGRVTLGSTADRPKPLVLPFDELLSLTFDAPPAATGAESVLEFANGDRLAASIGGTEGEALSVTLPGGAVAVPLETLRGIAMRPADDTEESAAVFFRESGADDLVRLTNGDRLAGQVLGLTAETLTLDTGGGELAVLRARIAAVAFSPELVTPAVIDGPRQIVVTPAGWLTVTGLQRTANGSWAATAAFGADVTFPAGGLTAVLFAGERVEFLSDREPTGYEFTPYLSRRWPLRRDRDVTGRPLAIGEERYPKGLGVHSQSAVTYDLGGRYESLRVVAGLAPSAGKVGNVVFVIETDGRRVFDSGSVSAADGPRPATVDLRGVQTLTLRVGYGRGGDVRDRANWGGAVLVRVP